MWHASRSIVEAYCLAGTKTSARESIRLLEKLDIAFIMNMFLSELNPRSIGKSPTFRSSLNQTQFSNSLHSNYSIGFCLQRLFLLLYYFCIKVYVFLASSNLANPLLHHQLVCTSTRYGQYGEVNSEI